MTSTILSASKKRINASIIVDHVDALRFALGDKTKSAEEVFAIIGISCDDFNRALRDPSAKTSADAAGGWFGLRTCSHDYFMKVLLPEKRGNAAFWVGVKNGYRMGVVLGQTDYINHAYEKVDDYAARLARQIDSSGAVISPDFIAARYGVAATRDTFAIIKDLLMRSPDIYQDSSLPVKALIDDINQSHGVAIGLGEYILYSESEHGFWCNGKGWVASKDAATPFDSQNDVYALPKIDAEMVSYSSVDDICYMHQKNASRVAA